jgi:hypothetical protein
MAEKIKKNIRHKVKARVKAKVGVRIKAGTKAKTRARTRVRPKARVRRSIALFADARKVKIVGAVALILLTIGIFTPRPNTEQVSGAEVAPTIVRTASTAGGAAATSHVINLPTGMVAGNTLIAMTYSRCSGAVVTHTWPNSAPNNLWTKIADYSHSSGYGSLSIAWHKVVGPETTVTVTTSCSSTWSAIVYEVSGASDPSSLPPQVSAAATGSSSSAPNSAALTPTGGSKPYRWITVEGNYTYNRTISTWPTNYTNNQLQIGGTSYTHVGAATRTTTAVSEDPPAFTLSGTDRWVAATVAVYPAPELPGVTISKTSTTVTEGGATDTYTVKLNTAPTATTTIAVNETDARFNINPTPLTFTTANWATPQTVTVTAVNNSIDEVTDPYTGGIITHASTSTDSNYNGISISNVSVTVNDNDTAGVTVTQSGTTEVTEGGITDSYTVVLTSEPIADVTIPVTETDAQFSVDKTSLVFTSANWNAAQTVTVTAVDDSVDEADPYNGTITHTPVSSTDTKYSALSPSSVSVIVHDNDTAGVTLSKSSAAVTEGGATDAYTVQLATQPSGSNTVTVNIGTADGQTTVNPTSLNFTTGNWSTPQNVTITAVNDSIDEDATYAATVTHTSTSGDSYYSGKTWGPVSVTVTDNDTAEVIITET